ncbi:MAG: acyl--CoA ligase [Rhodobacteraceae bacterium]|nr:acyl--CoA ligase [Paracoccaceae bacterium]
MNHIPFIPVSRHEYNIGFLFRDVVREYPNFPAIVNESAVISYAQLLSTVVACAKRFQVLGVDRHSIVALNTGDTPISVAVMLATSLLGCRMVTASKILAKQDLFKPTHFIRTADAKGKPELGFIDIDESWFANPDKDPIKAADELPGYENPDDPWLILHTSGTTGRPKFIELTHKIVTDRTAAVGIDFPLAQVTCAMLFNCTSRPFYARVIGALLNAATIVESSDPSFWKRCGVNTVFCSPGQFETFIEGVSFSERFKKVEVSGAKLDNAMAILLSKYFDNIVDVYGASETNKSFANLVTVSEDGQVRRRGKKLDSEVEIVDGNNNLCPPSITGSVRIRNGYIVDGYIEAPETTAKSFKDGWFYPGDVALWGFDGDLNIIGRDDEIISFGGVKIDAQLIDLIIKNTSGVKDAICFKSPKSDRNEILAFIVFEDGANKPFCVSQVRENYQNHTGLPCFLGRLHEIDEVPYNENGRPMRTLCQKMVQSKSARITAIDTK